MQLLVALWTALLTVPARLRRDERGQTAAEYLGIIAVIAVIIGVLVSTDIGTTLKDNIVNLINEIFSGGR